MAKAIDRLPHTEKAIVQNHYGQGVAFAEIARLLGLTKGRISQLHRAALKRLRDELRRLE